MINDNERYGRYAWDISFIPKRYGIKLKECGLPWLPLDQMVEQVQKIVHTSIEAVKKKDLDLSNKIFEIEQEIDVMYYECLDKLVEQTPTAEKCVVPNLLFVPHLERISPR